MFAADFSPGSKPALDQAARIARLQGARLHVRHVVNIAALEALVQARVLACEHQARTSSEGVSAALVRWIEQSNVQVKCNVHIVSGAPLHEILEAAKKRNTDLPVAGIAGPSALGHYDCAAAVLAWIPCRCLYLAAVDEWKTAAILAVWGPAEDLQAAIEKFALIAEGLNVKV